MVFTSISPDVLIKAFEEQNIQVSKDLNTLLIQIEKELSPIVSPTELLHAINASTFSIHLGDLIKAQKYFERIDSLFSKCLNLQYITKKTRVFIPIHSEEANQEDRQTRDAYERQSNLILDQIQKPREFLRHLIHHLKRAQILCEIDLKFEEIGNKLKAIGKQNGSIENFSIKAQIEAIQEKIDTFKQSIKQENSPILIERHMRDIKLIECIINKPVCEIQLSSQFLDLSNLEKSPLQTSEEFYPNTSTPPPSLASSTDTIENLFLFFTFTPIRTLEALKNALENLEKKSLPQDQVEDILFKIIAHCKEQSFDLSKDNDISYFLRLYAEKFQDLKINTINWVQQNLHKDLIRLLSTVELTIMKKEDLTMQLPIGLQ